MVGAAGLACLFPGGPEGPELCWSRWIQFQDAISVETSGYVGSFLRQGEERLLHLVWTCEEIPSSRFDLHEVFAEDIEAPHCSTLRFSDWFQPYVARIG